VNPEHDRFAELATRPLAAFPELREEARAEVFGRLSHGEGEGIAEATARLEQRTPHFSRVAAWAVVLAVVAMGWVAAWQFRQGWSEVRSLQAVVDMGGNLGADDDLKESLDETDRAFVYAAVGNDREVIGNLENQWELHPELPGLYEELAHRRLAAKQGLPPDFSATWRRIDPDNGMWLFLEAMGRHGEWKKAGPPAGETYSREVLDLLRQSAAAPRFKSHLTELRVRRLALLPPSETLAGESRLLLYSISAYWVPTMREQRETLETFTKAAELAATDQDREELDALIGSWERLVGRLGKESSSLLGQITAASSWKQTGHEMAKAARDLGMREQEARLEEQQKQFADFQSNFGTGVRDLKPMSLLARIMALGMAQEVDPHLYEPARRVEYAVVERMLGLAAAILVLLFLAAAGIESIRRGRRLNGLADGLRPLFRPEDLLWIAWLGVGLPALWYVVLTRATPYGLRDIGLTHHSPRPVLIQAGATLVFALLMIIQSARWRIGRRAGALSLKGARPWIGWTFAFVAAAVVPLAGGVRWITGDGERYLQAIAATGGLSLLWLLWEAGAVAFSPRDQALGGVLLCRRMILPLLLLAALLLAGWAPLRATERDWHARDRFTRSDRERGGLTFAEGQAVDRLREYFRKAFPVEESAP
jgi:hypothetical protein